MEAFVSREEGDETSHGEMNEDEIDLPDWLESE